jgi:integrase
MAYKEKDTKKWTAQWFETSARGEKKKRRKRGFETKREALEYERQKKLNNSRSMDMKLSEFMEVYFEDKQNELKERTMKNKRYMMEQHIIPYFGNQMMSEITAGQIIQWQNEMQTKGFSEAYLRMIQNQLTCLYTHASKIYDLHANPCKKVKRMGSSDSRSLDFWTIDEYQKFIQTMEPGTRYYLIFEILFWTGCRIGELLALTPKDIDFDRNQISFILSNSQYHELLIFFALMPSSFLAFSNVLFEIPCSSAISKISLLCTAFDVLPEIKKGLEDKLEAMVRRELYTKYKTAPTEEEREKARQEYLKKVGMHRSFRW